MQHVPVRILDLFSYPNFEMGPGQNSELDEGRSINSKFAFIQSYFQRDEKTTPTPFSLVCEEKTHACNGALCLENCKGE